MQFQAILEQLDTDILRGLRTKEATNRLLKFGHNKITEKNKFSVLTIFIRQFLDFLTILMLVSAIIALFANKLPTAIAIGIVVVINVFLGFIMEYKSEKSLEALKNMLSSKTRIIRDGKEQLIDFSLIVPGDVLIIQEGQKIPADAIIIEESNLKVDESALTGESVPVKKYVYAYEDSKGGSRPPLARHEKNRGMVFLGTMALIGHGKAVVVKTGKHTEFGNIAESLSSIKEPITPLQKQVRNLGKLISAIAFLLAILILILGEFRGISFLDIDQLMLAISIFISIVPAGLLVVMTLTLAIGVQRMAREKTIIKKLSSVETLGCAEIICTDKTGTLTENQMTAKKIWMQDTFFDIEETFSVDASKDLEGLIKAGVICNSAEVNKNAQGNWEILGDPTEGSLLVLGEKAGLSEKILKNSGKILKMFSFEQAVRRSAAVFEKDNEITCFVSGSPENVLEISTFYLKDGEDIVLDNIYREYIKTIFLSLASEGYRIVALARRRIDKEIEYSRENLEKEMTFLGLVALYDPPRKEVKLAIEECKNAGIRVVMITGDNDLTALAIAREAGLDINNNQVIKGEDIERYSDDELLEVIKRCNVFARVKPIHKLRIVQAFQKWGRVVAVTGDGVNDAPALKEANIGAAMGIRGTDVAKEASDMIIIDDNFVSISKAVKEGRIIYDNVKKFIKFLLTANAIETPLIITAIILGMPTPILPLHILWINFVTDSMPAITLGMEPEHKNVMKYPPRPPKEHILKGITPFILFASFVGYIFSFLIFIWIYNPVLNNLIFAQTMTFTFIVIYKLLLTFSCRSTKETIFSLGFFTNSKMIWAVIFSLVLQLIIIYSPFMQKLFETMALQLNHWLIIIVLALLGFLFIEAKKVFMFYQEKIKSR